MSKLKAIGNQILECYLSASWKPKGKVTQGFSARATAENPCQTPSLPRDEYLSDPDDPEGIQLPGPTLGVRCPGRRNWSSQPCFWPTSNATSWPTVQVRLVTYSIQFCVDPNETPPVPCSCVTLDFDQLIYLFWDFDPVYL